MSKGGGSGGTTTSVQKADPWSGLQGPLSAEYSGALNNYNSAGPQYFPGQTVAGTNGAIQSAEQQGTQMAMAGPSQQMKDAQFGLTQTGNGQQLGSNPSSGYFQNATNGQYLSNQNPYLASMFQAAANPVIQNFQQAIAPGIASQFSLAGRTGSGAHQAAFDNASQTLGRTLGDMGGNMYGNAYNNERQLQQQAASTLGSQNQFDRTQQQSAQMAAPQFENMKYNDLNKLMGIGQEQQAQEQQYIDAAKQRYDYGQQLPTQKLQTLNQLLQGGAAYNTTSNSGSTQARANPFASGMGGAFMGNVLGPMMGMTGPMGAIGGGLLGALFG